MSASIKSIIVLLSLLSMTALAQCITSMQGDAPTTMPTSQNYTIMIANNSYLGTYLADSRGMTLYHLTSDQGKNMSTCTTAACKESWPLFYNATIRVPPNLNSNDFGSITTNGNKQTTYKGWPLYYFIEDKKHSSKAFYALDDPFEAAVFFGAG